MSFDRPLHAGTDAAWPLAVFYEQAGRLFCKDTWDGLEADTVGEDEPDDDGIVRARKSRKNLLERQIGNAINQGIVSIVVDLKMLEDSMQSSYPFNVKPISDFDFTKESEVQDFISQQIAVTSHLLNSQRVQLAISDPSGFRRRFPIAAAEDRLLGVDWTNSRVIVRRSAILRDFTSLEPLFSEEEFHTYRLKLFGKAYDRSVLDSIPDFLFLDAYVWNAENALAYFVKQANKLSSQKREYVHHDWGHIYALMWRHIACLRLTKEGMQAQLVALVDETMKRPPQGSDLHVAASRVIKQWLARDVSDEIMHKTFIGSKDAKTFKG